MKRLRMVTCRSWYIMRHVKIISFCWIIHASRPHVAFLYFLMVLCSSVPDILGLCSGRKKGFRLLFENNIHFPIFSVV